MRWRAAVRAALAIASGVLAPRPAAHAAIEHDGDIFQGDAGTARLAFDATVGPGVEGLAVVAITTADAATPAVSVALAGVPLTFIGGATSPGARCRVEWWGLIGAGAGTQQVQVLLGSASNYLSATFISYHGVSPAHPTAGFAASAGPVGPSSVAVGGNKGDLVLDATCGWGADSILEMAGPQQTARWHWSTGSLSSAGSEKPAASQVTMTWTASGSGAMEWASGGLLLQAADGAAGRLPEAVSLAVETAGCTLGGRDGATGAPLGAGSGIVLLLLLGTSLGRLRGTPRLMRQNTSRRPVVATLVPAAPEVAEGDLDEVTLARAKAGDAGAQTALVQRYERPVFALLWRMIGPQRAVVEDLTQETFLRVLRAIRDFEYDGRARLITWILTIATRLALGHLRASRPHRDAGIAPGSVPVALPRPDQDVQRRALAVALVEAVDGLGDPFRAAFMLREVHGLSYDEIALALEIDIGTVKSRLARARASLQAALAGMRDE